MSKNVDSNKDKELFERELLPHIDALTTFAYHLTYNEEDSRDLVQDTYLKAYKSIDNYQEGTNPKAWLFKILKNSFINEFRKKSRRPKQVDFEDSVTIQDGAKLPSNSQSDMRHEMYENQLGDEVTLALNSLPLEGRTVVLLCDIEGFSYEEISTILEIPLGTVRSRLHRARNILKEKLKSYGYSMGYIQQPM